MVCHLHATFTLLANGEYSSVNSVTLTAASQLKDDLLNAPECIWIVGFINLQNLHQYFSKRFTIALNQTEYG
ncbi:hypothetical protein D9M71_748240 [compost metagenome]